MGEEIIAFRVPGEIKAKVEELARKMGKNVSEIMRDIATILALSQKGKEMSEALVKFTYAIIRLYPKPFERRIEYAENKTWFTVECKIKVSDEVIDYAFYVSRVPEFGNTYVDAWYFSLTVREYKDGKFPPHIEYKLAYPPTKKEIDLVIDALKRLLI